MTNGGDQDQLLTGNAAMSARVLEAARRGYREAVSMQPVPDPSRGPGSTDFPVPEGLQRIGIDALLIGDRGATSLEAFATVVARRRSIREYGPIDAARLIGLLDQVFELRAWAIADDGGIRRFRPVPSAGARHPLIPLVLIDIVNGIDSGLWRFDADGRQMVLVTTDISLLSDPWEKVMAAGHFEARPPAVVILGAQFEATLARYPSGSALVWRDAGIALGTLHLAATAAGCGSCVLGTAGLLGEDLLAICGLIDGLVGDVGSLSLGGIRHGWS